MALKDKIRQAWNAFTASEQAVADDTYSVGPSVSYSPTHVRPLFYNERSMLSSVLTRMSMDVASIPIRHVMLDEQGRYSRDMDSMLNSCLTLEPNMDQGPRAFRQDMASTLFDNGSIAVIPVDTLTSDENDTFDIYSMRVGIVKEWYPRHIKVSVYNEAKGTRQDIIVEKHLAAIVENPLYGVMNEPNGTLQRLTRKLQLLDVVDEQTSSGKLDLIIQLPYTIKSEARKKQAEQRREDIEFQLKGSKYGIAYTDGTEKITQLNRPAENNLLKQVEYLMDLLYSQLGITAEVMNGTADEATMVNYYTRTIEPILDAIIEAMQRSWLGELNSKNRQRIKYFRDPFKLVPISSIADIADKFSRNEILSANEIRSFMGIPPSVDPKADELLNSNINPAQQAQPTQPTQPSGPTMEDMDSIMNEVFSGFESEIEKLTKGLADE